MVPSSAEEKIKWHFEVLPRETKQALDILAEQSWLKRSGWYLAGGTALALREGNRQSVDLDFFLSQADFKIAPLLKHFEGMDWETHVAKEGSIYGKLNGAKISFIAYPFFVSAQKPAWYGSVRVLQPKDIAVMKLIAISQRGRKRDFYDLYWCAKNIESLESVALRLYKQYPTVKHNYHHIMKSLTYFEDAEQDPEPKIFFKASWELVKKFFRRQAPIITRSQFLA